MTGDKPYITRRGFTEENEWRDALGHYEPLHFFGSVGYCHATKTEAKTFCEVHNKVNTSGSTASWVRVGPCQYQVIIKECPTFEQHFFRGK